MSYPRPVRTIASVFGVTLVLVLCGCGAPAPEEPDETVRLVEPTLAAYQRFNPVDRYELLEGWRKDSDPKNLHFLVEVFGWEPVSGVRFVAAQALGRLPSAERDRLVTKLCFSKPGCAVYATDALKTPSTPEARAYFEAKANAEEWGDRYCLWMDDLGTKDTFAVPLAVECLANEQDDEVRAGILWYLYRVKTPESLDAMRSFFKDHPGWYEKSGQTGGRRVYEEMERELGVSIFAQGETR